MVKRSYNQSTHGVLLRQLDTDITHTDQLQDSSDMQTFWLQCHHNQQMRLQKLKSNFSLQHTLPVIRYQ